MNPTSRDTSPHVLALTVHLPREGSMPHDPSSPAPARADGDLPSFLGEAVAARPFVEIDVLLDDHSTMTAVAKVDWCERIAGGAPGRFDLGLRLVRLERGVDPASPHGAPWGMAASRARRVEEALSDVLVTRDAYLGAVRTHPTSEEILPEEARYMSAIRAAREVLEQTA